MMTEPTLATTQTQFVKSSLDLIRRPFERGVRNLQLLCPTQPLSSWLRQYNLPHVHKTYLTIVVSLGQEIIIFRMKSYFFSNGLSNKKDTVLNVIFV